MGQPVMNRIWFKKNILAVIQYNLCLCKNFFLFALDHVDLIEEIANDIYATYEFEAESSTIVNADLASQRITFDTGLFFDVWNKIHPLN